MYFKSNIEHGYLIFFKVHCSSETNPKPKIKIATKVGTIINLMPQFVKTAIFRDPMMRRRGV